MESYHRFFMVYLPKFANWILANVAFSSLYLGIFIMKFFFVSFSEHSEQKVKSLPNPFKLIRLGFEFNPWLQVFPFLFVSTVCDAMSNKFKALHNANLVKCILIRIRREQAEMNSVEFVCEFCLQFFEGFLLNTSIN